MGDKLNGPIVSGTGGSYSGGSYSLEADLQRRLDTVTGLTFSQETFLCTRRDGVLIAVEDQKNGTIERWATEKANRGKSLEIYGADVAVKLHDNK